MWQRIQTIFLAGVAICMLCSTLFPLWLNFNIDEGGTVTEYQELNARAMKMVRVAEDGQEVVTHSTNNIYIAILALLAAGTAVFSIMNYKNRLNQMKLNFMNVVLMIGTMAVSLYLFVNADQEYLPETPGTPAIGFYLIFVAMFLNLIANRFIRRDEQLVRSVDRIR